jgi:phosphate transport system permease protein
MNARTSERIAKGVIWGVAVIIIGALISIMGFILIRGLPAINWQFLTQASYDMGRGGGILPSIVGTVSITLLAVCIALPFGIGTAFYLAEYTRGGIVPRIIRFGAESLAGIPSIVYGLFGFIFFVDILGLGWSILAGGLTVAIMILPTIIRTSEEAILAVPKIYREASFSLGATKWQTIRCAVTPSAVRGIANGIILSVGRCIAETAAVILTAGSALRMADSIFSPTRTMAVHFFMLATEGTAMDNAYGTAAILIILIFLINVVANAAVNRFVAKKNKGAK